MFRFTIRDVLWLTVVVAFGLGWWLDRSHLARRLEVSEFLNHVYQFSAGNP